MSVDRVDWIFPKGHFLVIAAHRIELLVLMIQAVMESNLVRGTVERAGASVDDLERNLKGIKNLSEEVGRMAKAKIALA